MVSDLAPVLIVSGLLVAAMGVALLAADWLGLGRLPGDLRFGGEGLRVELPLATCVLVTLVATVVLNLFLRR